MQCPILTVIWDGHIAFRWFFFKNNKIFIESVLSLSLSQLSLYCVESSLEFYKHCIIMKTLYDVKSIVNPLLVCVSCVVESAPWRGLSLSCTQTPHPPRTRWIVFLNLSMIEIRNCQKCPSLFCSRFTSVVRVIILLHLLHLFLSFSL